MINYSLLQPTGGNGLDKIGIISLGCAKNLVDSENMIGFLKNEAFEITNDASRADVLIVNTCAFIDKAKEESVETILEMSKYKERGRCKALIVTGCLAERYHKELNDEIPEIDAIVGTGDFERIAQIVKDALNGRKTTAYGHPDNEFKENMPRVLTNDDKYAYVKIADGCNNKCSYCVIPLLRGKYRSRNIDDIYKEVSCLAEQGIKEIILIAQDTTKYGIDKGHYMLPHLIEKLSCIDKIRWIRLLYCYPESISDELIDVLAKNKKAVKYIDMPLQHINDGILKKMRRNITKDEIYSIINKLRCSIPDITLRTTMIVGFPGETRENFNELIDFVKEVKFDSLGAFEYSREEDTEAYYMDNQISDDIKKERLDRLMNVQQSIAAKNNEGKIGKIYEVIIDGENDDKHYIGRSYQLSPEIDGVIYVLSDKELHKGDFVNVLIKKASYYDLIGEVIE